MSPRPLDPAYKRARAEGKAFVEKVTVLTGGVVLPGSSPDRMRIMFSGKFSELDGFEDDWRSAYSWFWYFRLDVELELAEYGGL
jgi:hypothetical protein